MEPSVLSNKASSTEPDRRRTVIFLRHRRTREVARSEHSSALPYAMAWAGRNKSRLVMEFRPADGTEGYSGVYRDGIPSEKKTPDLARIVGGPPQDIAPRDPVASKLMEDLAREISKRAEADRAPPRPRLSPRVDPRNPSHRPTLTRR